MPGLGEFHSSALDICGCMIFTKSKQDGHGVEGQKRLAFFFFRSS
jgi:hypothetical protein